MNEMDLLGRVAAATLVKDHFVAPESAGSQARIVLYLTHEEVGAVGRAVLAHPVLAPQVALRVPREMGERAGLPEIALTDEKAVWWRNHAVEGRSVMLLGVADDTQRQSVRELPLLDKAKLFSDAAMWVEAAGDQLKLSERDQRHWTCALEGLLQAREPSVTRFSAYVTITRLAIEREGLPVTDALGYALPVLQAPRDRHFFNGIPELKRGHVVQWKRAYHEVFHRRVPLLVKRDASQQPIEAEVLAERFEKVADEIDVRHHEAVMAFIDGPPAWGEHARAVAELDWEASGIKHLFDGIRARKLKKPIGAATREHLDADVRTPDLSDDERAYLQGLDDGGATRAPTEEDLAFYERHRLAIAANARLRAVWDRLIFGRPIESDDLRVGILRVIQSLYGRIEQKEGVKELTIECARSTRKHWEDVNERAAHYFAARYKGLPALFGAAVRWVPEDPFALAAPAELGEAAAAKTGADSRCLSQARAANQVKFTVTLRVGEEEEQALQLVWTFDPQSILAGFAGDWRRLRQRPFARCHARLDATSAKGSVQALDLRDVRTLLPHGNQQRESLIASKDLGDIDRDFVAGLRAAAPSRLSTTAHDVLAAAWSVFAQAYADALVAYDQDATAPDVCLHLGDSYGKLLDALVVYAPSDADRRVLWKPVLELGLCPVEGGDGSVIVAPWHPLRIVAAAAKDRRLGGLVRYLLRPEAMEFGDARLFFQDVVQELAHPFYPEVCAGHAGDRLTLLACADSVGEYSLMESPTRDAGEPHGAPVTRYGTNDDPRKTAKVIEDVVGRFLALYPHEAANLSVVLFNCDAVGLPEAAVSVLGEMYDEDDDREMRCHVQLEHTDRRRLQRLYESLLEASARDSNSALASESTRDFMARLRVGIMASEGAAPTAQEGAPSDIVFLQDVVARLSRLVWNDRAEAQTEADARDHVPARWSRRVPATRHDEHSATHLCCPVQTPAGWSYLRAVWGLVERRAPGLAEHGLPVRRVAFDEGEAKVVLDRAHRLGQWVVNFDEILTRAHLENLGVRVIRHRRGADGARSVVVSSTAPLTMLHVLVRRNLQALGLALTSTQVATLAERLVTYASEVSGDIVLRAARRSTFAHELIGLALSRFLLDDELGAKGGIRGWYFLDDYASWLGQREGNIADILALHPRREPDGRTVLVALVSEAKYVAGQILQDQRAFSASQVRQTVRGMDDALFGTPRRLDRDHWLARLADLLSEGARMSPAERAELLGWQRDIAAGRMEVLLRGYSHVFVYAKEPDAEDPSARRSLVGDQVWQEVFGPDLVRCLLMAFFAGEPPRAVRSKLGRDAPWEHTDARGPAAGVNWATTINTLELMPRQLAPPLAEVPKAKPRRGRPPGSGKSQPAPSVLAGSSDTPSPVTPGAMASTPPAPVPPTDFAWASLRVGDILRAAAIATAQTADDLAWLDRTAHDLAAALRSYKLQAKLLDKRLTPNVALVRFQGSDSLRLWDVEQRRSQLLTTHGLNVIRIAPDPGALTIAVERPKREFVSLAAVLRDREVHDAANRCNERLVVGVRERDGGILYLDPLRDHGPHTLIAGGTGSGKSVLLQNLLLDIAMTNTPRAATITLIDPKHGVDYGAFRRLPHLEGGIIVERGEAIERLRSLVEDMEERYGRFSTLEPVAPNLATYNARVPAEQRLPVRWLVHDEFADWMLTETYKDEVQSAVQRLGVKARAAGIRLIFAAQRPEDRVLPVQLRDQLGNRLILRVASEGTSRIALGEEGAEKLLGKGHLAARLENETGIVYAQVPMLAPEVMESIVTALREERSAP